MTSATQTPLEMSRSPTVTDDTATNEKAKSIDTLTPPSAKHHLPAESTIGIDQTKLGLDVKEKAPNVLASLPAGRKTVLLLCFCTAMFM